MQLAGAALDDAGTKHHAEDGEKEALNVKEKAELFDILAVKARLVHDLELIASVDLRPAGEPGLDVVSAVFIALFDQVILVPKGRARTDDAHLADENIPDLRQLVQAGHPEKSADLRDILFRILELMGRDIMRGGHFHRAELVKLEKLFMQTDTILRKECRSGIVNFDRDHNNQIKP